MRPITSFTEAATPFAQTYGSRLEALTPSERLFFLCTISNALYDASSIAMTMENLDPGNFVPEQLKRDIYVGCSDLRLDAVLSLIQAVASTLS